MSCFVCLKPRNVWLIVINRKKCRNDSIFNFPLRSWVPLGRTQWRITSPVQSPALPGPRPAPHPWTPTMSKFLIYIYLSKTGCLCVFSSSALLFWCILQEMERLYVFAQNAIVVSFFLFLYSNTCAMPLIFIWGRIKHHENTLTCCLVVQLCFKPWIWSSCQLLEPWTSQKTSWQAPWLTVIDWFMTNKKTYLHLATAGTVTCERIIWTKLFQEKIWAFQVNSSESELFFGASI